MILKRLSDGLANHVAGGSPPRPEAPMPSEPRVTNEELVARITFMLRFNRGFQCRPEHVNCDANDNWEWCDWHNGERGVELLTALAERLAAVEVAFRALQACHSSVFTGGLHIPCGECHGCRTLAARTEPPDA